MYRRLLLIFFITILLIPMHSMAQDDEAPVLTIYDIEILNSYPHDTEAFTQGLLLHEGEFYESTGNCCPSYSLQSDLRRVDVETGEVLQSTLQNPEYFSEGLALVDDRLIQLTWRAGLAFVYDVESFDLVSAFQYDGEGWGLCYDGDDLFMSDGSSLIVTRDPDTFLVTGGFPVVLQGRLVDNINELECVGDYVYANVWQENVILQIDKNNGQVVGVVDATQLLQDSDITDEEIALILSQPSRFVLNGIAYNAEADTFFITGKQWPRMFEVQFVAREQ